MAIVLQEEMTGLRLVITGGLGLGVVDKDKLLDIKGLGKEHQAMEPNTVTGPTPFGELTRLGSQIDMSKTPEYWEDPILNVPGSDMPEWLPLPKK